MKKFLSIVLSLCIILTAFSILPAAFTARERDEAEVGETYTNGFYEYTYLGDSKIEIENYSGSAINLKIPSVIDTYTVTSIGVNAFYDCRTIVSLVIPNTVTTIKESAFRGKTNTYGMAYEGTPYGYMYSSITNVTIPESVTTIGPSAFANTKITSLIIPDSVISIGNNAFDNCCYLEVLDIGKSVKSIGECAFCGCKLLTNVTIPDSVNMIDNKAFGYGYNTTETDGRNPDFIVKGYAGTDAERYADENAFSFINLSTSEPDKPTEPDIPAQFIPSDAKLFNGHYYKVYNEAVDWTVAKENCEKLGGHLAVVTSSEEQSFIISLKPGNAWIGGYRETRNDWKWVTGETFDYSSWLEGEPNDSANVIPHENRIAGWPDNWNDLNEESREQSGYICEWEPENPVIPIIPGGKATVTLYDLQGKSETAEFETGDTFTVYTVLNTSDIDGGKIATLSGEQSYTSDILKLIDETDSEKLISDTNAVFPITSDRSMGNCAEKGKIYFSATESNINKPFVFNSDKCKLIVTTYKVIATGSAAVETKLDILAKNDDNLTRIISGGSVTSDSYTVKLRSSFKDPEIEPYKLGDANADDEVDTVDATLVQRAATRISVPYEESQMMHADIDIDGSLTVLDATFIQRYATRTKVPYPVGEYVS